MYAKSSIHNKTVDFLVVMFQHDMHMLIRCVSEAIYAELIENKYGNDLDFKQKYPSGQEISAFHIAYKLIPGHTDNISMRFHWVSQCLWNKDEIYHRLRCFLGFFLEYREYEMSIFGIKLFQLFFISWMSTCRGFCEVWIVFSMDVLSVFEIVWTKGRNASTEMDVCRFQPKRHHWH